MQTAIATFLVLALSAPGFAQTPPSGGDDAAIRRVVQQHDELRNKGDSKAVTELFTQDAEQLTSTGEWRKGRAQIEKGTAQMTATTYKGAKYTTKVETIRMLAPTVAIADGPFEISNIGGKGSRRGHTTYILVKAGDQWRIAGSRSMVPIPAGPTPTR